MYLCIYCTRMAVSPLTSFFLSLLSQCVRKDSHAVEMVAVVVVVVVVVVVIIIHSSSIISSNSNSSSNSSRSSRSSSSCSRSRIVDYTGHCSNCSCPLDVYAYDWTAPIVLFLLTILDQFLLGGKIILCQTIVSCY